MRISIEILRIEAVLILMSWTQKKLKPLGASNRDNHSLLIRYSDTPVEEDGVSAFADVAVVLSVVPALGFVCISDLAVGLFRKSVTYQPLPFS